MSLPCGFGEVITEGLTYHSKDVAGGLKQKAAD